MRISDLDLTWSTTEAHEIVIRQFPRFKHQTPMVLGRGWDNLCIIYPDQTVFRLPTRQMGGDIMTIESAVLPQIASNLPLLVPDFQFFGQPSEDYAWQFVGYLFLPGSTAERLSWTSAQRLSAAPAIGAFLRALHTLEISDDLSKILPLDLIDRTRKEALLTRIEKYGGQIKCDHPEKLEWVNQMVQIATEISRDIIVEPKLTIVHGDLYPRHLLANDDREIVAIIDWGDVHLGHPFLDLSIAYTFLDATERPAFWAAYGLPVTNEMKVMARLKAINYAFALYLYGRHTHDHDLLNMCDQIACRVTTD